jgi:ribosomal protein S1
LKTFDWQKIENQYPIGKIIDCRIISVHHFGVYLDINSEEVVGFVTINDFSKKKHSKIEFPKIDSIVPAIIIDYSNDERDQVWLSLNPKIIELSKEELNIMTYQEYFSIVKS